MADLGPVLGAVGRTCWQARLIFGRLACRQPRMPSVSLGLICNWVWQNRVTSGWQAARSRSLPWLIAAGGGCGGNCWAVTAVAAASTKAIDNIDVRIMVPPFAGIRPVATR